MRQVVARIIAVIAVIGVLTRAARADVIKVVDDACRADVRVDIFTDGAPTTLVDTLAFTNAPARSSYSSGATHSTSELAVPAARGARGVDVVGTLTGRSYLFGLQLVFRANSPPSGTGIFQARANWRISALKGGLVSGYGSQTIDVFVNGGMVVSKISDRITGLPFVGNFAIACGEAVDVVPEVSGTGGDISYDARFNYTGAFSASARGLVPAMTASGTVLQDPNQSFSPGGPGTTFFDIVVPAGTTYARFSLFNAFTDGFNDLDLYLYRVIGGTEKPVSASGGPTADEEINLYDPEAGTYRVWVHGYTTDGPSANFTLFSWILGSGAAGNMSVAAPAYVTDQMLAPITLSFGGLAAGTKYLGSVAYDGVVGGLRPTIVTIDTPEPTVSQARLARSWSRRGRPGRRCPPLRGYGSAA
jgi:hypothetical protein